MKKIGLFKKLLTVTASLTMTCVMSLTALAADVPSVYTGLPVSEELASTRPIAVMIPTDKLAQPSYGISFAKVLYEVMEEGNISRQMAVIDEWENLPKIGNIRSARKYYLPLSTEWDAIFVHFGGVYYMKERLERGDINNISGTAEYGTGGDAPGAEQFFRTTDRRAPHNAFIDGKGITRAATNLGYSILTRPTLYNPKHFTFTNGVNDLSQYGSSAYEATGIDLSGVFPYTKSSFTYDPVNGVYKKFIHNTQQIDGLTAKQLTFTNVIVQNTKWSTIDAKGYLDFQILDTTEDGYYFTKGRCIHVTWKKTADYSPTVYYDDNGNEIQLNPGNTYIAIAQKGTSVSFS